MGCRVKLTSLVHACSRLLVYGRQANFLVPLAEKYPEQAMSRFESGQFPINAASKMAYVKAASALGRMDQVDIQVNTGCTSVRRMWLPANIRRLIAND